MLVFIGIVNLIFQHIGYAISEMIKFSRIFL